jgi:hypothetical protein
MKAQAALLALTALVSLASCYGPGPKPPPPGPRGYSLDRPPGESRYGQDPSAPTDTRYLDTGDPSQQPPPPNQNDPAAATVQPPNPAAPTAPGSPTMPVAPTTPPPAPTGTTPPPPVVAAPPTTPAAPTTPAPSGSYPTATRTKPGFVKSPFDSLGREIDVREMRSGQKARCPYTQKVFLVP